MVTFAIVLMTIGMLVLPFGRLYMVWQKHKNNEKFSNAESIRKFMTVRWIVSIVLCVIAVLILFILQ